MVYWFRRRRGGLDIQQGPTVGKPHQKGKFPDSGAISGHWPNVVLDYSNAMNGGQVGPVGGAEAPLEPLRDLCLGTPQRPLIFQRGTPWCKVGMKTKSVGCHLVPMGRPPIVSGMLVVTALCNCHALFAWPPMATNHDANILKRAWKMTSFKPTFWS